MNDQEIISLFLARDESAISRTQTVYGARLFRLSASITGDPADAEECLNDTYLRAWNTIPPLIPSGLFAYLARIIRRLSLDVLDRRHAAKREGVVVELSGELQECLADPDGDAQRSDSAAIRDALTRFLAKEPPDVREIFVRRYFYTESVEEISGAVGRSPSAVYSALTRARKQLKKHLEKEGINL